MFMSVDLVPHIRVEDSDYVQPIATVIDVAAYHDISVMLTVTEFVHNSNDVDIYIATAMENRDERYVKARKLVTLDDGFSPTLHQISTFTGAGHADTDNPSAQLPSLLRYIRVETANMASGNDLVFDVKALLRTR